MPCIPHEATWPSVAPSSRTVVDETSPSLADVGAARSAWARQEPRTCIMYESPHRIADTLRGLLAASCSLPSSSCGVAGGGAGLAEGPEEEEEDEEEDGNKEEVASGVGEESRPAASVEADLAARRR